MTTTTEMIRVMQAYEDSKRIEFRPSQENACGANEWGVLDYEPRWNWHLYDYRVAPESKKVGEPFELELPEGDNT